MPAAQAEPRSVEDIKDRLDELTAEITNLHERFKGQKFTDEARRQWNSLNEEKARLEPTLKELRARRDRIAELATNPYATERANPTNEPRERPESVRDGALPALWPTDDEVRRLHAAVRGNDRVRLETRALVPSTSTGASDLASQLPLRGRQERRIAAAGGLQTVPVSGIESVEFPVFGADTAGIAAEGATKSEFDSITAGSATPQMISIWTDTTRQNILTMTNFEAKLRTVLSSRVANREDQLLVDTVLGTTGITAVAGPLDADVVLEAAATVAAGDVASEPNLVLLNPADVPLVLGVDVGAGGTASPEFGMFLPGIHGMRVYPTSHITAGEALVGAWNVAARLVVGLSPTFLVDAVSGIKTNTVTILLEEAVALAVDEPAGFAHISGT